MKKQKTVKQQIANRQLNKGSVPFTSKNKKRTNRSTVKHRTKKEAGI